MLETSKMLQLKHSHQKACAHRAKKTDWMNPWNRSISCLLLNFFLSIMFAYSQIFEISQLGKTHQNSVPKSRLQTSRASEQDLFIEVGRSDRLIIFPLEEVAKLLHCSCRDGGLAFTANCNKKNELFESPDTAWIEHIQETASQKIRGRILSAAFCCSCWFLVPHQSFSMLFRSCSNWRRQAIFCAALWRSSPHDKFETFSDHWKNWSW